MKRIGIFLGVKPRDGGMFQYAQSLLDAFETFPDHLYQIEVACVGDEWPDILRGHGFKITQLAGGKVGLLMANVNMAVLLPASLARVISKLFNPISQQLKRLGCDIWVFPAQDAIGYQLRLPAVATVHDLMHRYEPHFPEVAKGRRYTIREHRFRNLVERARGVLVDSEVGRRHVVDSYDIETEKVFSLPYVPPLYLRNAAPPADFELRHQLPPKFIFYPAQFWAHKNHMALVSAAAAAKTRCPDIHLVFTGGRGHQFERIRAHVDACGMSKHVTFAGYVSGEDLAEFYKRAQAMVMPTFFGPTNIPPLEAMVCDCPVAVSNIYAMPEQLGDAALYFDPRSVANIAEILERLWLDDALCNWLRVRGRQKVDEWNPARFAARLRSILDTALLD